MIKKMKIYFPSKFQHESGTGDTVSLQYPTITDVYNSISTSIDYFVFFEIWKKTHSQSHFTLNPLLNENRSSELIK